MNNRKTAATRCLYHHIPRVFIIALSITLSVGLSAAVLAAAGFTDVADNYWGAPYIEAAAEKELIKGYASQDGSSYAFKPENMVSKQESATMLYRTLQYAGLIKEDLDLSLDYADVLKAASIQDWAAKYASYGFKYGYLTQADFAASTTYLRGGAVNAPRQLIAAWAAKAMGYETAPVAVLPYNDGASVLAENIPYVDALYRYGIMTGDTKGNLNPTQGIKRVEFAAICTRLIDSVSSMNDKKMTKDKNLVLCAGTIADLNNADRTMVLTQGGNRTRIRISESAAILLDGKPTAFTSLGSAYNKFAAVSCIIGNGQQVIIQTSANVQAGTVKAMDVKADFTLVTVEHGDGTLLYYCMDKATEYQKTLNVGDSMEYIAEGAYLVETN